MVQVAIVEDSPNDAKCLEGYIARYAQDNQLEIRTTIYPRASSFLNSYHSQYDLILQDIELPDMNGVDVARKIRAKDPSVVLMFVTNLAQYAIQGYEVDALDYVLKPVTYLSFRLKFQRALIRCQREQQQFITIQSNYSVLRISASDLKYVEIYQHQIVYHTTTGDIPAYGILSKIEAGLPNQGFFRCSNSYIVNFRYVDCIDGMEVVIGNTHIPISRTKKREFLAAYHSFYGDMND